ncbi:uncharacterized protein LOC105737840 [Nomascus leucogenys]|uniref:uncharacterized protein LOC105737840 n=1 Tax=Nomascus leucogenys TaxID=61853 RepID=UPI00062A7EE8|nr:uncharacterized protein LOC105737840 [Nomascus leucogenys]
MASSVRQTPSAIPTPLTIKGRPGPSEAWSRLGTEPRHTDAMHTGVLREGAENAALATATGPSAWTSCSPFPPPHRGGRSKRPPRTVGLGFGFGGSSERGGGSRRNPFATARPASLRPGSGAISAGARWTPASLGPGAVGRYTSTSWAHTEGPGRAGPCRVSAGLSFPERRGLRRGLRHCPQCGTRPRLGWEPTLREPHRQGAPRAGAAAGGAGAGAGAAGRDAKSREGPAGQAGAGGDPRPQLAGEGGKGGPGWGPQAPGTSARAAGPGGTHRAWAPGRRRPARGPLAGSPPSATRAPLQPRSGGGTDSCVAALEGRMLLQPATGGRTGRSGSCRGRGGSRVRSRPPLQVPGAPPTASAAPASPTPRLRAVPRACRPCPAEGALACACAVGHPASTQFAPGRAAARACALLCARAYVQQGARSGGIRARARWPLTGMTLRTCVSQQWKSSHPEI